MESPSQAAYTAAYEQQKALGRSEVYAAAYASKIHEGELFAEHYATLRRRRIDAKEKAAEIRGEKKSKSNSVQPRKRTIRDFTISRRLGEGSYSMVYLATEKDTGDEFAIKILDKAFMHKENKTEYVLTEKEVFSAISSPHAVRLFYTFHDEQKLYFVIEYCKNGELLHWINKLDCFDEDCTRFYAAEIVRGLEHMHAANIIHRDLKPENILLDENMHVKLTDFGTSKILKDGDAEGSEGEDKARSFVGTAQYVSPELLTHKAACKSSDFWALGCIIYQLLSGKVPFRAGNDYHTFKKIQKLEYEIPPGFPEKAKDLVQRLLVLDPDERLGSESQGGIESIKSHPFFEGIVWDTLADQTPPKLDPFLPAISPDDKPLHAHDAADDELADIEAAIFMKSMGEIEVVSKEDKARQEKLAAQAKTPWHKFVDENELIIKSGLVDKRKGLFAKRRQLILTDAPRLLYVDPDSMEQKGEIPWSKELMPQYKNMKTFFVHTPNRTYYLEDVERTSITWVDTIKRVLRM